MIRKCTEMKEEVREHMRGGPGSVTVRHAFMPQEFGTTVRLCATCVIPPGAGIGPHQHMGEDEVYMIIRGEGILDDGISQTRVQAGDAVLTGDGGSHALLNCGEIPLEVLAFIVCYDKGPQS